MKTSILNVAPEVEVEGLKLICRRRDLLDYCFALKRLI